MTELYKLLKSKSSLLLLLFALAAGPSGAHTYYVDTVGDSGPGSLRAAIDSANDYLGFDSIVLQLSAKDTIYLASPLPAITDSVVITGLACQNPTISGGLAVFNGPAFHAVTTGASLTLNYLNIINCINNATNAKGGAVWAQQLHINYCYFNGNNVSSVSGTGGKGGAVYANNAWLSNSTFCLNTASNQTSNEGFGGALYISGILNLSNCTFDNDSAVISGGAIYSDSMVITNCTIVNCFAGTSGGGIFSSDSITIANSIVWNNAAGVVGQGLYLNNSTAISGGCNVFQTGNNNINISPSDIVGTDPMLDTLGYFNGCVPVIPILCGSVAQNHATCAGATTTDAEGIPAYGIRDAGAFEITPPNVGGDTIDSIQPGATADLMSLFNTQGLSFYFIGHYTDSTLVDTGTYTIVATNYLGCSDTAVAIVRYAPVDTMVDSATAVRTINSATQGISVFPNPAENIVNVKLARVADGPMVLKIFDATGRVAHAQNLLTTAGTGTFSVSGLSNGLYYIEVTDNAGRFYCSKLNVLLR